MKNERKARTTAIGTGKQGFTLIEVMLVVVILGILAGVAVIYTGGKTKRASIAATRMTIDAVGMAVKEFEIDNGVYPSSLDELTGGSDRKYLERPARDAWGNALNYSKDDGGFKIVSAGPDKQFGTGDDLMN